MTIVREIGGTSVKITLTDDELYCAYKEKEHMLDICDVQDVFTSRDDEELMEAYGMTRSEIANKYDEIATEMRKNIDKYDMRWQEARDAAIADVL